MTDLSVSAAASLPRRRKAHGVSIGRVGLYGFLIVSAVFFAVPLLIMLMTSFKSMDEIRNGSLFALPLAPTLSAWDTAWFSACTGLYCDGLHVGFFNSVKIVVPAVIGSIAIAAINGFALAQWRIKGADTLMTALMLGAFIPYQVILFPMVKIFSSLGLYGTLPGIILIHIIFGQPMLTLIFRNFYTSLPVELVKAARMDGAGFFRTFLQVMLPLSSGILIVAAIMQVTGIWNDYLFGLIFAGTSNFPMTVQLNNIVNTQTGTVEYNVNMAATLLTAIPPLVVYFLSGRYFVRGIASGAVKG